MKTPFRHNFFQSLRHLSKILPTLSLLLSAGQSQAANVSLGANLSGAGATWLTFSNTGYGFGFQDASTLYGGDAFDVAGIVTVNGIAYNNPDADVDVTGNTLTSDAALVSGITVSLQYTALTSSQTLRTLVKLTNSSGSALNRTVSYQMNWGSDGNTTVRQTSSGDASITVGDRWTVTSDFSDSDPVNLTSYADTAGLGIQPVSVSNIVFDAAGTEGLALDYSLAFDPNETLYLLFFHDLYDTSTQAITAANLIYNAPLSGERVLGLPTEGIVNYSAVPEPSAAVISLLGAGFAFRRRR